jgi:TPR repeat protein
MLTRALRQREAGGSGGVAREEREERERRGAGERESLWQNAEAAEPAREARAAGPGSGSVQASLGTALEPQTRATPSGNEARSSIKPHGSLARVGKRPKTLESIVLTFVGICAALGGLIAAVGCNLPLLAHACRTVGLVGGEPDASRIIAPGAPNMAVAQPEPAAKDATPANTLNFAAPPVSPTPTALSQSKPAATPLIATPPQGQSEMGFNYRHGVGGVQQDLGQAAVWYRKAADQGYAEAQFRLGSLYEDGLGIERDHEQAKAWYRKAALQGNEEATAALKRLEEESTQTAQAMPSKETAPEAQPSKVAAPVPAIAAQQNAVVRPEQAATPVTPTTPYGQYEMGYFYYYGLGGVNQDYRQAAIWYRKAADQGYADAQFMLGNLYVKGLGVEIDYDQARVWYQKASEQGNKDAKAALEGPPAPLTLELPLEGLLTEPVPARGRHKPLHDTR